MYTRSMILTGELTNQREGYFAALLDVLGVSGQGRTRNAACRDMRNMIVHLAQEWVGPLEVTVTHDGEHTVHVSANDSSRLIAMVLHQQRAHQNYSLAKAAKVLGARSRNSVAQYETGKIDPSLGKLTELMASLAPDYVLAIVPRTAQVLPREVPNPELDALVAELERAAPRRRKRASARP